jgi:NADH:ubiquinone oxidoreductase subunit F (NADH-binding)/NADH:ubiquinone oxidoreductase subunit E
MELIQELERTQVEHGHLGDGVLRDLARRLGVPLYRLQALVSFYPHFRTEPPRPWTVDVCRDMSCFLNDADAAADSLETAFPHGAASVQAGDVEVRRTSCLGCCELAPAIRLNGVPQRFESAAAVRSQIEAGKPSATPPPRREWRCDPYRGDEPRYRALRSAVEAPDREAMRDRIVGSLEDSGLRGMGGAGFPTGLKWKLVRAEMARPKYVVCNADESEPGTFKDRVIMEDLPHLLIEGMALAGMTIGAEEGIIYLRHEYGAARAALEAELEAARAAGALGESVFGSDVPFEVRIFISPGGYILGEETALLEALEDKRGEPRNKPPFPGQKGLWNLPTLMNNVETLAYVPGIVLGGADAWKELGANGSGGLKFIAVSGHVERPGVYEIPIGTSVAELIDLAGGVADGRALKAFAPGGASSQFLPAGASDVAIDFEALAAAGSMMGSGALVVVAEGTPILPLAANVVRFFRNESCGKCVPCRDGTEKTVRLLEETLADGTPLNWATIEKLNLLLVETSICGLGYVALNPLLSAAEHWPTEVPHDGRVEA